MNSALDICPVQSFDSFHASIQQVLVMRNDIRASETYNRELCAVVHWNAAFFAPIRAHLAPVIESLRPGVGLKANFYDLGLGLGFGYPGLDLESFVYSFWQHLQTSLNSN